MLERALETATDEPRVEGVVAVLNEDRALGEPEKRPARIPELRRADQHRAVDVMALARIRIDGGAAVDQSVEEGKRAVETESLGTELEDQEWRVARRLHIDGDELGGIQRSLRTQVGCIDGDLLPGHRLRRAARLEKDRLLHQGAGARARLARRISSGVTAFSINAATA
jgi:hypothetical protein